MFSVVEVLIFLIIAIIVSIISKRAGISDIILFLFTGVVIGPHVLNLIQHVSLTEGIGNIGVIFLLFTVGLHLPIERLKAIKHYILVSGGLQMILTSGLYATLLVVFAHQGIVASILLGLSIALSSTAIVLKILENGDSLGTEYGKMSFGILLFQDFAIVIVMAVLPTLYENGSEGSLQNALVNLTLAFGVVLLLIVVAKYLLKPLFKWGAASGTDIFIAVTLASILGISYITNMVGMSMELGAFIAGLLLAGSEFRLQVEAEIKPFKGIFLGIFFLSVGMSIDVSFFFNHIKEVVQVVFLIISVKALVLFLLAYVLQKNLSTAIRAGLLMAAGGEFAFLLLASCAEHSIISEDFKNIYFVAVSIAMTLNPFLNILANYFGELFDKHILKKIAPETIDMSANDISGHVIIAGFGRVGQTIASLLSQHFIPFIAIDANMNRVVNARVKGLPVFYGDAKRLEIFRLLNITSAKMLIITLGRPDNSVKTASMLLRNFPKLDVWMRLNDHSTVRMLEKLGANVVTPQLLESSLQLGESVLKYAGVKPEEARKTVEKYRETRASITHL